MAWIFCWLGSLGEVGSVGSVEIRSDLDASKRRWWSLSLRGEGVPCWGDAAYGSVGVGGGKLATAAQEG